MKENKKAVKQGGSVAKRIIKNFEKTTGKKVVSDENYLPQKKQKSIKNKNSD